MIQIYKPGNRNYEKNGDAVLHPEECVLTMNVCGAWEMTIENPADENINLVTGEAVIKTDTPIGKDQLFRIYEYEKTQDGISARARPIFFDAAKDTMLLDVRPTKKTGSNALQIMVQGTGYTAQSDITDINTAYYVRKNLIEAISGEDENSFLNRWGGEPIYNNRHVTINRRCGADRGARAVFGHNLESIEEKINLENVVTRIVPEAYNGYTLEGDKPWVDSPNIDKYDLVYTKVIQYSDVKLKEDAQNDETAFATKKELQEELKRRAKKEFEAGIDLPEATYSVSIADLEGTIEYEDIKDLVKISLGDTVYAQNEELDITTNNRCVQLVYDCILQRNKSVVLGDTQTDYFTKMTSIAKSAQDSLDAKGVKAERVHGIVDMMQAKMRATAQGAVKQADKAILFEDIDPESETFGAMAIGTTGFMIACERTTDNRDWDWRTFGTGRGFLADCLIGGVLLSLNYIAGQQGFKLDLNEGVIETAQMVIRSMNKTTQGMCSFRFRDGVLELLDTNDDPVTTIQIYDYKGTDNPGEGGFEGVFRIETKIKNGYTTLISMDSKRGSVSGSAKNVGLYGEEYANITGKKAVRITGEKLTVNQKDSKTGRAEFSDGTYLEFENGFLVGGNTKAGAF